MSSKEIVTLTLNPALDLSSSVDQVVPTHKLRCALPVAEPGGGGINVARVCARLGESTAAIAALGGSTGEQIRELLEAEGLAVHSIEIDGETRQSMSVIETTSGKEFRFVFPGPTVRPDDIDRCCHQVTALAKDASCLVISGSMPPGVDGGVIADIVRSLPGVPVIVDTAGPALRTAIETGCHLAKPSAREMARLVGRDLPTEADIAQAATEVMASANVAHLVVSLGPGGSLVVSADGTRRRLWAPAVDVRSTVGAGDSMVAGMAVGIHRGLPVAESLSLGVAAGTAAVLTDGSTLCEPDAVQKMLPLVRLDETSGH